LSAAVDESGDLEIAREEARIAADARAHHRSYLVLAVLALGLSLALDAGAGGGLVVPVIGAGRELPVLCPLKAATGWDCPGCGLSRSFVAIAHGRIAEGFAQHRIGLAIFLLAIYQLAYRPWMMRRGAWDPPGPLLAVHRVATFAVIAALVANWIVNLIMKVTA
jgi:hypothetical protein